MGGRGRCGGSGLAIGACAILIYSLAPIIWILIASITPELRPSATGTWQSARAVDVFSAAIPRGELRMLCSQTVPFATYFRNSAIIALGTMTLALTFGSLAAYGFVRFRFRFRGLAAVGHADGLHDPERGAAGAADGAVSALWADQQLSRHDPGGVHLTPRPSCCC